MPGELKHVMVDLETMGTAPNAVIAAIGAVVFDPVQQLMGEKFYTAVDMYSCQQHGLVFDGRTVSWWFKQSLEAREALADGVVLERALMAFDEFCPKSPYIWGNGATFDNTILRSAYAACHRKAPWHYRGDRDVRTLVALTKAVCGQDVKKAKAAAAPREGVRHNALDDAAHQVRYVCECYRLLKERGVPQQMQDEGFSTVIGRG